jgi:hypothetical protein
LEEHAVNAATRTGSQTGSLNRSIACAMGILAVFAAVSTDALADPPALFGDLGPLNPEKLSKDQLEELMPGAKMSRVVSTGSTHFWTNGADGTFVISTDNKSGIGTSITNRSGVTAPGKWHIAPEGRYCVTIEWKKIPTEDWCRYVFKTSDGYFATKSDKDRAEKVYQLRINGI